jgi:Transmembrane secretion effector
VPGAHLRNAVTLNSVTVNLARVFGAAAGGGIAAALGLALCFDLNPVSFGAVVVTLALMSADAIRRSGRALAVGLPAYPLLARLDARAAATAKG